jgi:hypothetical protein
MSDFGRKGLGEQAKEKGEHCLPSSLRTFVTNPAISHPRLPEVYS